MVPILMLLAAQANGAAHVPTMTLVTPSAGAAPDAATYRAALVDIEVRGGGTVLWSGPMRVSTREAATFDRRRTDAPSKECDSDDRMHGPGNRETLSINLSIQRDDGLLSVRASWERQAEGEDCRAVGGTRSIALTEKVPLQSGKVTTIKGDGGFVIVLRQR